MKFVKYRNIPIDAEMDTQQDLMRARILAIFIVIGILFFALLLLMLYKFFVG